MGIAEQADGETSQNIAASAPREGQPQTTEAVVVSGLEDSEAEIYSARKVTNTEQAWEFVRRNQLSKETCWLLLRYQRQLSYLTRDLTPLDDVNPHTLSTREAWPYVMAALTGGYTSFNRAVFTTMGNKKDKQRMCLFTATGVCTPTFRRLLSITYRIFRSIIAGKGSN